LTEGEVPQADSTGGYGEGVTTRFLEGSVARRLFRRLSTRANASIGLTRYRYHAIGNYTTLPVTRDQVQQSYRIEGLYNVSRDFTSGVSLDVSRSQLVNLPSASTAANNTQRVYRAEWRWTYRLLRGLTATQRNTLGATYSAYKAKTGLAIVVEGDPKMFNPYGIIAVNPARHPGVNYKGARLLIDWITSPEGQKRIASFKPGGQQLFFPSVAR
jgi:hypothetical protein